MVLAMSTAVQQIANRIAGCRLCADRFATTATRHAPRPVLYPSATARLLIASQAPGARVHASGVPFDDASGDRLREWLGVGRDVFYDRRRIAIVPMAFCFPGYDERGADLPPPRQCAHAWRAPVMAAMPQIETTLLVGGYAQKWHLGREAKRTLTETVRAWRDYAPRYVPLPHPSWRNTAWLKRNPWFEEEVLPWLRSHVRRLAG
jgi:uracil-DNA glycosylase